MSGTMKLLPDLSKSVHISQDAYLRIGRNNEYYWGKCPASFKCPPKYEHGALGTHTTVHKWSVCSCHIYTNSKCIQIYNKLTFWLCCCSFWKCICCWSLEVVAVMKVDLLFLCCCCGFKGEILLKIKIGRDILSLSFKIRRDF